MVILSLAYEVCQRVVIRKFVYLSIVSLPLGKYRKRYRCSPLFCISVSIQNAFFGQRLYMMSRAVRQALSCSVDLSIYALTNYRGCPVVQLS